MDLSLNVMRVALRKDGPVLHRSFALTLLLFLVAFGSSSAQNFSGHNWYFGNTNQGIRFSRSDNSASLVTNKFNPFGTGGSAVASDPINGNLLFYSDGVNIYDVTHTRMPGGSGLTGNPSGNQPVAFAKVAGTDTQYYVFTNSATSGAGGTISYRIVDMALPGNAAFPAPFTGDVTPLGTTPVIVDRSESMMVIQHANGRDFWLITHEHGGPSYAVSLFNNSGLDAVNTTTVALGLINVAANFSYHPASGRIAVSPQERNRDIEVLNFNPTTGALTFNQSILNSAVNSTITEAIYDTEWSNNGQYLYLSRHGEPGIQADVLQFDFLNPSTTLASVLPQPNTLLRSFGLQMGPDSAIYHLYESNAGIFNLGTINNTDTVASEVVYDASAFSSNTNFQGTQFPSFAPKDSIEFSVTFTTEGTCSNSPISFFPTVIPAADSLIWSFGDGQFGNGWSPVHTYAQGGPVTVEVIAFLNGDTARASQPLNLTQFDLQLTLVQDTTACACELPANNGQGGCPDDTSDDFEVSVQAQGGTPQYQWFGPGGLLLGQTTETLRPDSAGYYYVVGTQGTCQAYAGVNIKEYDSLDQRANIWYFGQNAGIDFNPLPDNPAVAITGPLNTPEGTSVISDRNGQVIFSTDGFNLFDKSVPPVNIAPATGIGGDNGSSQSALIIPVTGDETLFYIFTTNEIYGTGTYEVRYSLFDLKLNNGLGGLAEVDQLLFGPSTERITGNANWLIAHEYGNNSFRAYRISASGISNPIISAIGSDHASSSESNGQGYMKLGAQNRLAVALSTTGVSNVVEIFDFIDSTGSVTNFRTADLNSAAGQVYGVEFSPEGNKLFATLKDANSQIYEFAFDTLDVPYLKQAVAQNGELGAMQIGPDGQIYVAINGSSSLGMFQSNPDTTQVTGLTNPLQPFALAAGTTSTLGLPNFIQTIANPTQMPTFSFTGLCLGDSTQFSATGKDPAIDKFDWVFGDGQSAIDSGAQIAHLYAAPGSYNVVLTIRNKCETPVLVIPQTVVINDVPPDPSNAVALCTGTALLDANPQDLPNLSYVWSTGDSTETITVNRQANYTVTVTDALGCSTDGTILAADNRPQIELGPNTTICQNTPVAALDAQNPGATYAWQINGAASGTTQTQNVNTSVPGLAEYKVLVTDPVTTCFVRDSITYTINESPAFTAIPGGNIVCNTQTGQITLNFATPIGSLFSYSINGTTPVAPGIDQSAGSSVATPANLAAGTYGVTVTDQVSGCATTSTASINTTALNVSATQNGTCDPITLNVAVNLTPGPLTGSLGFRVINNATGAEVDNGTQPAVTFTTDEALASNNQEYVVEVTTPEGCVATSPIAPVNESPTVPVTLASDPCSDPVTITATGGTTWLWSTAAGSINDPTLPNIQVTGLPQGRNTLNLTVTDAIFCALDTSVTVNVNNNITAGITQSDACADQVILTANPAGAYTYRWFRNGVPVLGGQQILVGLADNGSLYRVDVVNTVSGCPFPSPDHTASVTGELQFILAGTPPCEDQPFTLTATANQPDVIYEWSLAGTTLPETSATLVETRGGLYEVTGTSADGNCSVTQTWNVVPSPVTEGTLSNSGIICPDPANPDPNTKEVLLDPGSEFTAYEWFRDGSSLGETEQTYTATTAGTYSVNLINFYGCPSSDETLLIEDCTPRITGPNAFRPTSSVQGSGEYTNRNFLLFTFFIDDQDFEVFIFNRWGEMVHHTTERDFRWNGGYNNNAGEPLPTGTYTWVVRYRSSYRPEQGILEKRGGVVLLR